MVRIFLLLLLKIRWKAKA